MAANACVARLTLTHRDYLLDVDTLRVVPPVSTAIPRRDALEGLGAAYR